MTLSFLSFLPIIFAVFLFSLWRPKIAIFLPIIFHVSFLIKTSIFSIPSTGLELLIVGVLMGVWAGMYSQRISVRVGGDLSASCHSCESRNPSNSHALISALAGMTWTLIILFVLSATTSAVIAPHFNTAWGAWKAFVVEPILYAVTLVCLVKRYNLWNRLILSLFGGGVVVSLLSLVFWRFGADFWRFRGIYDVPNSLALILAPLLVMAVLVFLNHTRLSRISIKKQKLILFFTIIIFGLLLLATQSISGMVAAGFSLALFLFIKKGFNRKLAAGLFVAILLVVGMQIFSGKIPHMLSRTSSSFIAREQIWTIAMALIKDHALIGTGLGTFESAYQEKLKTLSANFGSVGVLEWVVRDPHNIVLSFWLNTGLLGLLSMGGLIVVGVTRTYPPLIRGIKREQQTHYRMLAGSAMITLVIFGLFDVPYWKNDLALLWWVYLLGVVL